MDGSGEVQGLEAYRQLFPITRHVAYMNHAAAGPVSLPVIEAVQAFLTDRANRGSEAAPDSRALAERTRAKVAAFMGATTDEIAFMKATPDGLNAVANGLAWHTGDNVVTADIEFPANVYPWMNLRDFGVTLKFVRSRDGRIAAEDVIAAIDDRTRVVALSWVEFHGGFRNDLATIGAECRRRGVFLAVDGIQGLGVLRCDVRALNVDFLCAASQKWVLAPHGIAPFFVRREVLDRVRVAFVGLAGVDQGPSYLDYQLALRPNASRFEPGYINQVGIAGLEAAIDLFNAVGMERVEKQALALTGRLADGLTARGYIVYGPQRPAERSSVTSFRHPHMPAAELVRILREGDIVVSEREEHVRVSPHFYNTFAEIDRLLDCLPAIG
jgi:cysteine desulfurase/selenocysteine lyase